MMKQLAEMTPEELKRYLHRMGEALPEGLPEDASFVLVLLDPRGQAHYVSNFDRPELIHLFRHLAGQLEKRN